MNLREEAQLRAVVATRASFDVRPKIPTYEYRGKHDQIVSVSNGIGTAVKKEPMRYTGTKLKGIGVMHKSNLVPIFNEDEATDLAHMRR